MKFDKLVKKILNEDRGPMKVSIGGEQANIFFKRKAGAHVPSKKQKHKKERKEWKQKLNKGEY